MLTTLEEQIRSYETDGGLSVIDVLRNIADSLDKHLYVKDDGTISGEGTQLWDEISAALVAARIVWSKP